MPSVSLFIGTSSSRKRQALLNRLREQGIQLVPERPLNGQVLRYSLKFTTEDQRSYIETRMRNHPGLG